MSRCAPRPGAGQIYISRPFDGGPIELVPVERERLAEHVRGEALFPGSPDFEVEIGFGKGRSLIAAAQAAPDKAWLGIELSLPYVRLAAERAAKRGIRNLRLLRAEASEVFGNGLEPGKVTGVHVFFPDPWPKKRHHKRRLIQDAFLAQLETRVAHGARFRLATDHEGYFQGMCEAFAGRTATWEPCDGGWDAYEPTNYEVKYRAAGKPIHRLAFRCLAGVRRAEPRTAGS